MNRIRFQGWFSRLKVLIISYLTSFIIYRFKKQNVLWDKNIPLKYSHKPNVIWEINRHIGLHLEIKTLFEKFLKDKLRRLRNPNVVQENNRRGIKNSNLSPDPWPALCDHLPSLLDRISTASNLRSETGLRSWLAVLNCDTKDCACKGNIIWIIAHHNSSI